MPGLVNRETQESLPLRSSSIFSEIKGFTARTTAILTYYNDNRKEIEGLFILPIDHATAIVEFESVVEGHYMCSEVRYIKELKDKVPLFENVDINDGIFNVSVGKISPWVLVEIQVTIVGEVGVTFFGDALRYTLPQVFSPTVTNKLHEPRKPRNSLTAVSTLGYSFQIEILIEAPCLLCGVQSNTHPIQVDAPPLSKTGSKLRVSLPDDFEPTDEVFELLMFLCRPREPYIIIEEPKQEPQKGSDRNPISHIMNNPILMLSYSPDITVFCKDLNDTFVNQVAEYMLMIECGTPVNSIVHNIREISVLFLRCLPVNCFFNVLTFSNTCESVFPTNQAYSAANLEVATNYVMNIQTYTLQSTSLMQPIDWLYKQEEFPHVPKNVFMITSGGIKYSNAVIDKVRKKHHIARCFTFCLGSSENSHMLETLSSLTKAQSFILEEEERPHKHVIKCLKAALQPTVTNLKVSWILPDAYDVIYTPENLPPLLLGDRLNLFAILAIKDHDETAREKNTESISSVKEFWFEDFEPFDEFVEKNYSSTDILTGETTETQSPAVYDKKTNEDILFLDKVTSEKCSDLENEVFLTEEEASKLQNGWNWQKQSSIDRVQTWKVSKFPENDIEVHDDAKVRYNNSTKEKDLLQRQNSWGYRKKSNSIDGVDSTGSSISFGSNLSSSGSHFLAFPGYPTRLGSCRSIEERSPHYAKLDEQSCFSYESAKEKHPSSERSHYVAADCAPINTEASSSSTNKEMQVGPKPRQKLTQALIESNSNTHSIDNTNEKTIEALLEAVIQDKRRRLYDWLNLQEEMTQCTWPLEYERKATSDKSDWRDSGIGHRSSSEARTSDPEEDHGSANFKKSEKHSKSSSGYFDTDENKSNKSNKEDVEIPSEQTNETMTTNPTTSAFQQAPPRKTSNNEDNQKDNPKDMDKMKQRQDGRTLSEKNNERPPKKKFRPKIMWNALIEKVKTLTTSVSEKSGEATFQFTPDMNPQAREFDSFTVSGPKETTHSTMSVSKVISPPEKNSGKIFNTSKSLEKLTECTKLPEDQKPKLKSTQRYIRNRPLIENSRTISTSSMFEIGQSEIGDVDNLHLLPSHALIYLSGQYGHRSFKRIIPFQLVLSDGKNSTTADITVHQLAARSIIRDLEIQMDQDEMLVETGRDYVKTLISDVSKSSHILSKYTAVVTINDKCKKNEVLSVLKYNDTNDHLKIISPISGKRKKERKRSNDTLHKESTPLYEIQSEADVEQHSKVWHTKLTLKTPKFPNQRNDVSKSNSSLSHFKRCYEKSGYMRIVELMTSDGCWELTHSFAEVLSINFARLRESCPFADPVLKNKSHDYYESKQLDIYEKIWVTALAIIWLRASWTDYEEEWSLIDLKVRQWLSRQKLPKGFVLDDVFLISQQTLKILTNNNRNISIF